MKLIVAILIFGFGCAAYAGDAGCGLGSQIIQKNSKVLQLFAMTTNASLLTQPLGITSGTSGCSASGLVMTDKQMQYFVESNQEDLSREMAQGHGEKLSTLALLNGCADETSQKAFSNFTQKAYREIVPSASVGSAEMVSNLRAEMEKNAALVQQCHGS